MNKISMSHEEVLKLLHEGNDMPYGWKSKELWRQRAYDMWRLMWRRCYDPTSSHYRKYCLSIIHDDFRLLSNFIEWIQAQPRFEEFRSTCHEVSWTIDKDMKVDNNIHYYPEFMSLCTMSENSLERHKRNPNPSKPIRAISLDGYSFIEFTSVNEVRDSGFTPSNVYACLKGRQKSHKGYRWEYIKEGDE